MIWVHGFPDFPRWKWCSYSGKSIWKPQTQDWFQRHQVLRRLTFWLYNQVRDSVGSSYLRFCKTLLSLRGNQIYRQKSNSRVTTLNILYTVVKMAYLLKTSLHGNSASINACLFTYDFNICIRVQLVIENKYFCWLPLYHKVCRLVGLTSADMPFVMAAFS